MTRKDFDLLANTLTTYTSGATRATLFCEFARVLKSNYPNFDHIKWFNHYMEHDNARDN
jgi:hypothetical protein